MKKNLLLLLLLMSGVASLFAQEVNHLKFLDVSMELPYNEFADSLAAKGMEFSNAKNGISIFTDYTYAGYDSCMVQVESKNDVVFAGSVLLPVCTDWNCLEVDYNNIKQMLTDEYGRPQSFEERFVNTPDSINIDDVNAKYAEALNGRCRYNTLYLTDEGRIFVTILKYRENGENICRVSVRYMDYENFKK